MLFGDNLAVGADPGLDTTVNPLPVEPSSLLATRQQARGAVPPQGLPMVLGVSGVFTSTCGSCLQNAVNAWISSTVAERNDFEHGHIKDWDVSAVEAMSYLFYNKGTFNDDISSWNTGMVTNMHVRRRPWVCSGVCRGAGAGVGPSLTASLQRERPRGVHVCVACLRRRLCSLERPPPTSRWTGTLAK